MANRWGKSGNSDRLVLWTPKSLQIVTAAMKLSTHAPLKKGYDQPRQCMKKQRHYFANKGLCSPGYCSPTSHVWMWELEHKDGWAPENWCFWTVVLVKIPECLLDWQRDQASQSYRKSSLNSHCKEWYWKWSSDTLTTLWGELTH